MKYCITAAKYCESWFIKNVYMIDWLIEVKEKTWLTVWQYEHKIKMFKVLNVLLSTHNAVVDQ